MFSTKWSVVIILASAMFNLAGCGGGSTLNVKNPPPPGTSQNLSIVFQPVPPSTIKINAATSVTAVVTNDAGNGGVDWSVSCSTHGNCGSISPLHTTSGQPATFTPPATLTSNNQTFSIVAFATDDHTKNVTVPIAVNAYGDALSGTFVLQTNGVDASGFSYQRAGVVALDGNGGVTGGEQTVNFFDSNAGALVSVADPVTGGSYFVGADGRGSLTVTTADTNIGQQGVETFSLVVLSSSRVLLSKADNPSIPGTSNESSVGTMDLQTSVAAPAGGYAFVARGTDPTNVAFAIGGVLNIDSPGGISGTGSVFDAAFNDGSGTVTPSSSVSGTVSSPDTLGAVQVGLATDFGQIQLTGYVIDSSRIAMIESDVSNGSGIALTAGVALGQGAATGTFTHKISFSGTYVMGAFGQDLTGVPSSLAAVATFHATGTGFLTLGFLDETQTGAFVEVSDKFHATYAQDTSGSGRMDTNGSLTFAHVANGTGPELVFYLTGKGNTALVLDADTEPNLGGAGVGIGIAYPITTGATFSGSYGFSFTQNLGGQADATGEITADNTALTLSGIADANSGFAFDLGSSLTGSFQTTTLNQRLTGTLSNPLFPADVSVAFYLIDSNRGLFAETDGGPNGANPGFLTLGYFESRTPVCQGCP